MRKIFHAGIIAICTTLMLTSCIRNKGVLGIGNSKQVLILKNTFPIEAIQQVVATTSGGNIKVIGDASDKLILEIYGSFKSNDSAEIVAKIKEIYDISINRNNSILTVSAQRKKNFQSGFLSNNNGTGLHYVLHVGKNIMNTLKTEGGNISMLHIEGNNQEVFTSGGNIEMDDIHGDLKGETSGGNIKISNTSGKEINFETSGGNIEAYNIQGNGEFKTSGGNIHIEKVNGNLAFQTSGGNVIANNITGAIKMSTNGGNIEANNIQGGLEGATNGGDIHASLSSITSNVVLDNGGGNINISIPKNAKVNLSLSSDDIQTVNLTNFSGKSSKQNIEGSLNGGGPTVSAKNTGGSIQLQFL